MAHNCPDCYSLCHCGGDIDDLCLDLDEDVNQCSHCDRDDDDFYDDFYETEEEQMESKPYERMIRYRFTVMGEEIDITEVGPDYVCLEEVSKDGQEDCHMAGMLRMTPEGEFAWEEGKELFIDYESLEFANAIQEYLDTHGLPDTSQD